MAILMGDLRAGMVNPGATEQLVSRAATEVATYEARLAGLESRVDPLTWMVGANLPLTTAVLFRVFH